MDFFTLRRCRRAGTYANIMAFLGQSIGVNASMYYMSVLLHQIGFDPTNSNYMSLVRGGVLLFRTMPAIFLMETCGPSFWAIMMLPGFCVGLVLIGVSYLISLGNLAAAESVHLTGLILYMGFFGPYACLTWVIPAEPYPTYEVLLAEGESIGIVYPIYERTLSEDVSMSRDPGSGAQTPSRDKNQQIHRSLPASLECSYRAGVVEHQEVHK